MAIENNNKKYEAKIFPYFVEDNKIIIGIQTPYIIRTFTFQ